MVKNDYQYELSLFTEDQTLLGQVALKVDWEPARECAEFQAIRAGHLSPPRCGVPSSLHPIWHRELGEPYVEGFRICVPANGSGEGTTTFTTSYFKALALQTSKQFVASGRLKEGDQFQYVVAAFNRPEPLTQPSGIRFTTEEIVPELPIEPGPISGLAVDALPIGLIETEAMRVFVPRRVLDETAALSSESEAKETGGILIGHLRRDAGASDVCVEVVAQIPARHTEADLTRLTFTAETWTEVRAALELRKKGELMLGWWHSHPVREWCKSCDPERQQVCQMAGDFFSAHDQALHRTVFPRAYSIALVVNDVGFSAPTYSLFGWRQGLIQSRGFYATGSLFPTSPGPRG